MIASIVVVLMTKVDDQRMVRCWRGTLKQPFGIKLFWNIHHAHPRFLNKTVLVINNDVTAAFHLLNRLMNNEGLLDILRKTRYYRKPYMQRNELSREISKAIINEDMRRKIQFLMRKNRPDPYPGQMTT
uniref:Mitochondrial ribosomal protein S21 n=2 Tax=Wuchereria bancrofti TaxID=6293 RepID=A0A1I8EBR9_WUCBA